MIVVWGRLCPMFQEEWIHFVAFLNCYKNLDVSDNFNTSLETSICILHTSLYLAAIDAGFSL